MTHATISGIYQITLFFFSLSLTSSVVTYSHMLDSRSLSCLIYKVEITRVDLRALCEDQHPCGGQKGTRCSVTHAL